MIPTLATDRLMLRPPALADFESYAAFWGSARSIYQGGPRPRREAWRDFACDVAAWTLRGFGVWSVDDRTGGLLGWVGLFQPDDFPEPEIGWTLLPEAEGRGVASEAARTVCDWAYQVRGPGPLVSYIDPENARSIALARRLGAVEDPYAPRRDPADLVFRHPAPERRP